MKKCIFILMALLLCGSAVLAQQVAIEKSAEFDEPEYGWNKLLQLKNGNTFYFHSTKRDGIEVTVYNKERKQISSRTLESRLWDIGKMRESKIVGLYEINGEPVLFIVQADDRVPILYRMRINPNNGSIANEFAMGHLPKVNAFAGYAVAFGHVEPPDIIVEKDPLSDCYAAIYFNSFAHDRSERIKVVHYDGTHKMLGQAYYESPKGAFKYLRYIGAVVDANKRVFIATYGYNSEVGEQKSRIIVSRLNAGDTGFVHKLLDFSDDFSDTRSVMLYNHYNNKIQLLTLSYMESGHHAYSDAPNSFYMHMFMPIANNGIGSRTTLKKQEDYFSMISYLDPESLTLTGVKELAGAKVTTYGQQNIDKDYDYDGIPQQMLINKDNTTTVLSEEITNVTKEYGSGSGAMYHHSATTHKTLLGPIGISELSDTGAELRGYAISKKQQAEGTLPLLYINTRSKGRFNYPQSAAHKTNDNEFLSFDYIDGDKGRYIVFNDLPVNSDKDEDEEKRKTVTNVSNTNTMCYKLNDPKMDKFFLFGEPGDKHNSTFCYIESSDYNKDLNTYATMIVERDGRDKAAKIAWVKFQ